MFRESPGPVGRPAFLFETEAEEPKIEDQQPKTGYRRGWGIAAGAALLLVGGAFLPPLVQGAARDLVQQAFAPVCHQMPARSFAIGGVPLAVCHRCLGIYVGLGAGVLMGPLLPVRLMRWAGRRIGAMVLAAGTPAALDWLLGAAGVWAGPALAQAGTGALLGMALGLALARAAAQRPRRPETAPSPSRPSGSLTADT